MAFLRKSVINVTPKISIEIEVDMKEKTTCLEITGNDGDGVYVFEEDIDNLINSLKYAKKLMK